MGDEREGRDTDEQVFGLIAEQRRRLAELASGFDDEAWATPSLAEGWRIRDVYAHLTMPFEVSVPRMVLGVIRARGDFDAFADRWARQQAAKRGGPAAARELGERADARFTPPGMGPQVPLADLVIHGLDVTVPLGLLADGVPQEAWRITLDVLVSRRGSAFGATPDRVAARSLVATDIDWWHGERSDRGASEAEGTQGDSHTELRAPALDLILHLSRGIDAAGRNST